jgi:hypothetical protein
MNKIKFLSGRSRISGQKKVIGDMTGIKFDPSAKGIVYVEIESATFDVNPNPIQDSTFVFLFDLDLLDNATGEVIRTISGCEIDGYSNPPVADSNGKWNYPDGATCQGNL